ncbi:hypothetical protein ElyMa_005014200 [Elysia marginata]|uniref:Paired domain-containing protein n=1 Tax=Elysia marginata TaxID=1093978 RepID=A0AAV4JB67_9GAST|nr:hypothetical protein ElyMa_005014200 [Elysia marginata]
MEYQSIQHLPPPHYQHNQQQDHHSPHLQYHYHRLQQHLQQYQHHHRAQTLTPSGCRLPRAVASALQAHPDSAHAPSGRWSASSEIAALRLSVSSSLGLPIQTQSPNPSGNAERSVSVLSGSEYIRVVNARGAQRLVRRKLRQSGVPPAAVRGVGAKIHQRCVLSVFPFTFI